MSFIRCLWLIDPCFIFIENQAFSLLDFQLTRMDDNEQKMKQSKQEFDGKTYLDQAFHQHYVPK
jgi:hypothetical protein